MKIVRAFGEIHQRLEEIAEEIHKEVSGRGYGVDLLFSEVDWYDEDPCCEATWEDYDQHYYEYIPIRYAWTPNWKEEFLKKREEKRQQEIIAERMLKIKEQEDRILHLEKEARRAEEKALQNLTRAQQKLEKMLEEFGSK